MTSVDPTVQMCNSGVVPKQIEAWGRILYLSTETQWSLTYASNGYIKRISKVSAGLLNPALLDGGPSVLGLDDLGDAAWALDSFLRNYSDLHHKYEISDEWRQFSESYYAVLAKIITTEANGESNKNKDD